MWLKLNLDGIVLSFRVKRYIKTDNSNWDTTWCRVDFCLESESWLKYEIRNDEILLASEVDSLIGMLKNLLSDHQTEQIEYECIEPDFSFVFNPKKDLSLDPNYEYVSPKHRFVDIDLQWKVFFWNDGLTDNYISVTLDRTEIEYLLVYLKVIAGDLSEENDDIVKQLIQKNILY